tara:strand:- start:276 stop:566 length:291 start_codon:yes stop_codon:yes gene_type:complete
MDIKDQLDSAFDHFFNPRSIVERVKNGKGFLWYNPKSQLFYKTILQAHEGGYKNRHGVVKFPTKLDRTVWFKEGDKWLKHDFAETLKLRGIEKEWK